MVHRMALLCEEDLKMQDHIENFASMTDDVEDILLNVIETRYNTEDDKMHLFTENHKPSEFSQDEETAIEVDLLNRDYDDDDDDLDEDDDDYEEDV